MLVTKMSVSDEDSNRGSLLRKNENILCFFTPECLFTFASLPHSAVTMSNETECGRVNRTKQSRVHLSPYANNAGRREAFRRPHSGHFKVSTPAEMC